jgi:hypothetical protein
MPVFATRSRSEPRAMWIEAWRKRREGLPAEPLEIELADVAAMHPEYHATLQDVAGSADRDWTPEQGESNPFLHMGLHVAVREGLTTDRPQGIAALARSLAAGLGSMHAAEHALLDCMAETLWEAQRSGMPPDELVYLDKARSRLR